MTPEPLTDAERAELAALDARVRERKGEGLTDAERAELAALDAKLKQRKVEVIRSKRADDDALRRLRDTLGVER